MIKLLQIEYNKISRYWIFWGMAIILTVGLTTLYWGIEPFINENVKGPSNAPIPIPQFSLYEFPNIWHNLTYLAGMRFFLLFPALLITLIVTNEYTYRTLRQNVIDGLSRNEIVTSKIILVFVISASLVVLLLINGFLLGLSHSKDSSILLVFEKFHYLGAYFLEVFAFGMLALLIGTLVKKALFAIGILLTYSVILEPIAHHYSPEGLQRIFPLASIGRLIDVPNSGLMRMFGVNFRTYIDFLDVTIVMAWTIIFALLTYLIIRKRDL